MTPFAPSGTLNAATPRYPPCVLVITGFHVQVMLTPLLFGVTALCAALPSSLEFNEPMLASVFATELSKSAKGSLIDPGLKLLLDRVGPRGPMLMLTVHIYTTEDVPA